MNLKSIRFAAVSLRKFLMLMSVFLLAVILTVVSSVLYRDVEERIRKQTEEIGSVTSKQYMEYVEENFKNLDKLTGFMAKDASLQKLLKLDCNNIMEDINRKLQTEAHLARLVSYYDYISSINIISSDKEHMYYGNVVFSESLLNNLKTGKTTGPEYFIKNAVQLTNNVNSQTPFCVDNLEKYMYMHFTLNGTGTKTWDVWITLNRKLFFRDNDDLYSTAFRDNINIIYNGPRLDGIDHKLFGTGYYSDGNESEQVINNIRIYSKEIPTAGLTAFYAVDAAEYMEKLHSIRVFTYLIYLFSLIIAAAASGYISGRIIKPVNEMNMLMSTYNLEGTTTYTEKRKTKKEFSLREKIFYYMLVTILVPTAFFMLVFLNKSSSVMKDMIINLRESVYSKTSMQLNRAIENKIEILQKLSFDSNVQNYLMNKPQADISGVGDTVENMRYLGLNRGSVTLYDNNGSIVFCDRYRNEGTIERNILKDFESINNLGVTNNATADYIGDKYLSLCMPVICLEDAAHKSEKIGFCRIDSEYYRIRDILSVIKDTGSRAGIVDSEGKLVFEEKTQFIDGALNIDNRGAKYDVKAVNESYSVYINKILGTTWYFAVCFDKSDIRQQGMAMAAGYAYLFILILLITIILSHFVSMNLLQPIMKLNNLLKSYDVYGDYPDHNDYFKKNYFINEINSMGENFSKMADRIETLIDDLIITNNEKNKMELERKSAEITALQAQINPHFLYNTLNNIIALIKTSSYEEAILTVKLLSTLFKYGISRAEIVIPIREEIEYARAYTQIMKIRHRDRISFEWDIENEALNFLTVKLIMQPLIENSIRHGFNCPDKKGTVFIRCREENNNILFEVEDDGIGIAEEETGKIKKMLDDGKYGNKIGIFNVQSRIRLHYGKEYGLEFSSIYGKGTCVSVRIPKRLPAPGSTACQN